MLVLTPAPHPTECLSGYLLRLGTVNGYPTPACIVSNWSTHWHRTSYRHVSVRELMEVSGLSQEVAERVCLTSRRGATRSVVSLLGMELHASEVRMDTLRICPVCVADTGRHEAFWHLKLVNWCPMHGVALLERCKECGQDLVWNRPAVGICKCGADLLSQREHGPCSEMLSNLLLALRAAMYDTPEVQAYPERLKHLRHLDIYSLSRLIFVLCRLVRQFEGSFEQREADEIEYVERVSWLLADWPINFHSFIKKHYEAVLIHDRNSFRKIFDWAYYRLQKNLKQRGKLFSFLTDELYCIGAQYVSRDRLTRGDKVLALHELPGKWGSVPEAAAITGMDPRTVLRHAQMGKIPARKVAVGKRNRNYVVDLDWARQWRFSQHPRIGVTDVAKRFGITVGLLRMLRKLNIYTVRFHTFNEKGYSREDVERFEAVLKDVALHYSVDGSIGGIAYCGVPLKGRGDVLPRAKMLQTLIERRRLEDEHQDCLGSSVHVEVLA